MNFRGNAVGGGKRSLVARTVRFEKDERVGRIIWGE
jgi:hypothetical protein